MSEHETITTIIAQNMPAIITAISSLASAALGSFFTVRTQKIDAKLKIKTAEHEKKVSLYIDLLSACQEIRCLATEYASYDRFPNGDDEGSKRTREIILNRYCKLANDLNEASVKICVCASKELASEVSEFSKTIYDDFVSYLKFGTTKLSNDTGNDDSKLQVILDKIEHLEEMIRCDVQKGVKL